MELNIIYKHAIPHCPHCDIELIRMDREGMAPQNDMCWTADGGVCLKCGKYYTWTQWFKVCGYNDLKEVKDDD